MPSISIITATYNAGSVLPSLIDSLRMQTDQDFEWIVVDGNSRDNTVTLLNEASDVVTQWVSECDFGIYDALNKGVRLARGEFYLVCGADDRLSPTAIAEYRKVLGNSPADIVAACVSTDIGVERPARGKSWRYGHAAFIAYHAIGCLIRKSLHEKFGFYSQRFPIAADQYFIKQVCMSPNVHFVAANFVAGHYSIKGVSGSDIPGTLTEFFRIQLETEPYPAFQLLLFGLRVLRYSSRIVAFGKLKRQALNQGA